MFTDIQGSSELWDRLREGFRPVLFRHNELLHRLVQQWDGYEVKSQGDSLMVAFRRPTDAVHCAFEMQRALTDEVWPAEVGELLIRIGIHTGEPFLGYDGAGRLDYFGPSVNRAARIAAAGHGGQVLLSAATWEAVREVIGEELLSVDHGIRRLRGLEEPERLIEVRLPDLPTRAFPPLRTLDQRSASLPQFEGPFIGRLTELPTLRKTLLSPTTRLVTLVGFGGMGKTRTAVLLAELCAGNFADGVCFIPLEEVRDAEEMQNALAAALKLSQPGNVAIADVLHGFLREREFLLVLDNVEQIPLAGGLIREIIASAPKVKCLATSRRRLQLRGERVVELPPLPQDEAERLFVELACQASVEFELSPANAGDVRELCRRLEGIPLAIELAAARSAQLTPREMLARLQNRFRLLRTEAADYSPRQKTLLATVEWSHSLLEPSRQELFAELSVFAGGFTLADAEQVLPQHDLLEGLGHLRVSSLLRAEVDVETQENQFFFLESIREYAQSCLEKRSEVAKRVRERHAGYYLAAGAKAVAGLRTAAHREAIAFLFPRLANLRNAAMWVEQTADRETAARAALVLSRALLHRGAWREARELVLRHLNGLSQAQGSPGVPANLLSELRFQSASLAIDMGLLKEANCDAEACVRLRSCDPDPVLLSEALNMRGTVALLSERSNDARRDYLTALRLTGRTQHGTRGKVLHNLAILCDRGGDRRRARRLYRWALRHRRLSGDLAGEVVTLGNLGVLAQLDGDYPEARRFYEQALAHAERLDDAYEIGRLKNNLGEILEVEGHSVQAFEHYADAERRLSLLLSPHVVYPRRAMDRLRSSGTIAQV